jgi:hypothetical protein
MDGPKDLPASLAMDNPDFEDAIRLALTKVFREDNANVPGAECVKVQFRPDRQRMDVLWTVGIRHGSRRPRRLCRQS